MLRRVELLVPLHQDALVKFRFGSFRAAFWLFRRQAGCLAARRLDCMSVLMRLGLACLECICASLSRRVARAVLCC